MSMPQANRYAPGPFGLTTTVTGFSYGRGWFTPKSFITISVAQVRSVLRVTTSFTGFPAFTFTTDGSNPLLVTVSSDDLRVARLGSGRGGRRGGEGGGGEDGEDDRAKGHGFSG